MKTEGVGHVLRRQGRAFAQMTRGAKYDFKGRGQSFRHAEIAHRRTIIVSADGEIRIELDGDIRDRASSHWDRLRIAGKTGWTIASAESFRALLRSWLGF